MPERAHVIPLFKGDVPPPSGPDASEKRRLHEAVITGINPDSQQPMEHAAYLEVLKRVHTSTRQIAENVARVFASTLKSLQLRTAEHDVRQYFLEGCVWDWGTEARTGAETSEAIYGILPESIRGKFAPPHVDSLTKRTRDEFEHLLEFSKHEGVLVAVTHGYHQNRAVRIGAHMKKQYASEQKMIVETPKYVAAQYEKYRQPEPSMQFMIDAIRIAEPSIATKVAETAKEKGMILPLHLFERLTGKDLEAFILAKKAGRHAKKEV